MKTAKDELRELLDNPPDDPSFECARRSSVVSQPLNGVEQSRMMRWFVACPDGSRSSLDGSSLGGS
jgi:hypothetical protein